MTDVFAGEDLPVETEQKFEDLVGEGKKYKDQDAVAKALMEKDRFIEQLKQETAEARRVIKQNENEKSFLERLEAASLQPPKPQDPPVKPQGSEDGHRSSGMSPEDVEKLIEQREAKRQREANLNESVAKLRETFGDNYKSRVQTQAKALGVGTDFLTDIAATNPQAFYRLMEMDKREERDAFAPPPRSTTAPLSENSGRKDWEYFRKLRQEKGESWYFSVPVQQEIWRLAQEAAKRGESFAPK
jgi:hypothetical protein